jgi:hypothetical protein
MSRSDLTAASTTRASSERSARSSVGTPPCWITASAPSLAAARLPTACAACTMSAPSQPVDSSDRSSSTAPSLINNSLFRVFLQGAQISHTV